MHLLYDVEFRLYLTILLILVLKNVCMELESEQPYKYKQKDIPQEAVPSEVVKIACPTCHAHIKAGDINIDDKIAKCSSCDSVFFIHDQVSKLLLREDPKHEVIRPEGIDLFEFRDALEISVKQPWTALEVIPAILLPFLAIIFTIAFFKKGFNYGFALASWISTAVTFFLLAQRKKHWIYINIDDKYLSTFWRPKKLHKDKHFPIDQVNQLYVRGMNGACSLILVLDAPEGQKHIKLIGDMSSLSKAKYLEQEIERYLKIPDRKLPEEA